MTELQNPLSLPDDNFLSLLELEPFNKEKHTPIDLPNGAQATEYTTTSQLQDGSWMVHPQIWFDQAGRPKLLKEGQSLDMALGWETFGNTLFPRFSSQKEADSFAKTRSNNNGGLSK